MLWNRQSLVVLAQIAKQGLYDWKKLMLRRIDDKKT